ncbi:MAG TPA: molybdate ABC transporter substrate-binding protein [Thermoanaerobaculia bacterium]|nr:molybdate ABC transporter substrate-binding protein [Thermoanaerobaculia bacterium]
MRRLLAAGLLVASCAPAPRELDVAAASSLQDALHEVARGWEARGGERVVFNFAGSNVLARQIEAGAPVDVFLSADTRTAESIRDFLEPPVPLLANTLVVVSDRPMTSLRDLLPLGHVAIGDPSAVPAGVYARQALQQAGVWPAIEPKIVPCENVRAALKAVESGGADAAIVYATDARLAKQTRVALTIDSVKVMYPIAVVRGAKHAEAARRFVDYCRSDEGMRVFAKYGFAPSHVARTSVRAGGMNPAPHFG